VVLKDSVKKRVLALPMEMCDIARKAAVVHAAVNPGPFHFRFEFVMIAIVECVFAAQELMKELSHTGCAIGGVK
jgi:hypothetical protein